MSVRMRHTRGHTGNRRSHHALKAIRTVKTEAGALTLSHRVDETTGMYRGKQIFTPRVKTEKQPVPKGPDTEPVAEKGHDHTHEHANAEVKGTKGVLGKLTGGAKPKARSGMGGQAGS